MAGRSYPLNPNRLINLLLRWPMRRIVQRSLVRFEGIMGLLVARRLLDYESSPSRAQSLLRLTAVIS